MGSHVLVETFGKYREKRELVDLPEEGLRIHLTSSGDIQFLRIENFCKVCNGSGGAAYHFGQGDRREAACPICNGGSQGVWDSLKRLWDSFMLSKL